MIAYKKTDEWYIDIEWQWASTFSEKIDSAVYTYFFWRTAFQKTLLSVAATFSEELLFYNTFSEELLFHSYSSIPQLHYLLIR